MDNRVGDLIALFFGTRPQVIKASVLRDALSHVGSVAAVDTGQHYDYTLHQVHYDQLGVRAPDAFLNVGSSSHAAQTAAILKSAEEWIAAHRPRIAVVIGDTNSTLACALAAVKSRVPVAHVEAGLYAADRMMAEEVNRRAVDAIAELLFTPCDRVATALRRRHPDARIENVGDVAYDVLRRSLPRLPTLESIPGFEPSWGKRFALVTLHRAELVDAPERLGAVLEGLEACPVPCLFPAHPRTAAVLRSLRRPSTSRVKIIEPVGYLESLALLRHAAVVVTDSGGLQREGYWLGIPTITVRQETEWLETVQEGANVLVPPEDAATLPTVVAERINGGCGAVWDGCAYGDGGAAVRIADTIADWL